MSTKQMTAAETDALAARAAGGDREALAELYRVHQKTVLKLVKGYLRGADRADLEDAAQEVWADVLTWIGDVEPEGFLAWLADLAALAAERIRPSETAVQAQSRFAPPLQLDSLRPAVIAA